MNKYEYLFVVQGNYGQGWEDLWAHEVHQHARAILRDYQQNEPATPVRVIQRRVLREESKA